MILFQLTTPESIVPEPELRAATAVDLTTYAMMELRFDSGEASVLVQGLENYINTRSRAYVILDAEHFAKLWNTPVLAADVANDLTSDQAATGGTTTTVVKSGAGWTADEFRGKVIVFTGGTNGNADGSVRAYVTGNTTDTITFTFDPDAEFAAACDNTTTFRVHANVRRLLEISGTLLAMDQLGKAGELDLG